MVADTELGAALLAHARNAVAQALGCATVPEPWHTRLLQPGATFVTLRQQGELRGCIGSLTATRPLLEDVRANARAAAFEDPRFAPLDAGQFGVTRFEVSLLTPPQALPADSEEALLQALQPYQDGLVLRYGSRRATFLPQVWHSLPQPRDFLRALKRKAGLAPDFWSEGLAFERYQALRFEETGVPVT